MQDGGHHRKQTLAVVLGKPEPFHAPHRGVKLCIVVPAPIERRPGGSELAGAVQPHRFCLLAKLST